MKKFLTKHFLVYTAMSIMFFGKVYADSHQNFIKNLLIESDMEVCEENIMPCGSKINIQYASKLKPQVTNITNIKGNVLLICDSDYNFADLSCSKNEINVYEKSRNTYELSEGTTIFHKYYKSDDKNTYVVPENILLSSYHRSLVVDYINETTNINYVSENSHNQGWNSNNIILKANSPEISYFETLTIVLSLLVIYILINKIPKVIKNKDRINVKTLSSLIGKIKKFFSKNIAIPIYFLFFFLLGYAYLLMIISVRDTGNLSYSYITNYIFDTTGFSQLSVHLANNNMIKISLVFVNMAFVLLIMLIFLPLFLNIINNYIKGVSKVEIKAKYFQIGVWLALFLLIFSIGNKKIMGLHALILSFVITLTFLKHATKSGGYKTIIKICLVLILAIFSFYSIRYGRTDNNKEDYLVDTDSAEDFIVPQSIVVRRGRVLQDFFITLDKPLFVENYVVYHPNYKIIENKNINSYGEDVGNHIIYFSNLDDFVGSLMANKQISSLYIEHDVPNVIKIDKNSSDPLNTVFETSCDDNYPTKITIQSYYIKGDSIQKDELTTINIPPCGVSPSTVYNYSFPHQDYISREMYIGFMSESENTLSNIRTPGSTMISSYYHPKNKFLEVINNDEENTLVVYSNNKGDASFESSDNRVNIASVINNLVANGLIDYDLTVWEPEIYKAVDIK